MEIMCEGYALEGRDLNLSQGEWCKFKKFQTTSKTLSYLIIHPSLVCIVCRKSMIR
jgi:hypothetical protein